MIFEHYAPYATAETMMGPSSLRILAELLDKHPLCLEAEDQILDLGCGTGLTTLALAKETGAKIAAADLWIKPEQNAPRFETWGIGGQAAPVHADARQLPFALKQFRAMVSVDAYHYFAGEEGFFAEKILPFLQNGAAVLIGIPGVKDAYEGRSEELLSAWLGDEAYMFKSPNHWRRIIGSHPRIESVESWEMNCFEEAWGDWFASGHRYAKGDREHFDTLIRPYTCFVGIHIRLR